jgi:hypothetical protein
MSGESGEASAVVTRNYRESGTTCDSCAQAVLLLLNFGEIKQKGRSASGPDDVEESKNDHTDPASIHG